MPTKITSPIDFPKALKEIRQTLGQAPYDLEQLEEQASHSFDNETAGLVVEYLVDSFQVEGMED